jgi:heme-degrading monooxygenase HmoA
MVTVITYVTLKEGTEPRWDALIKERLDLAKERRGWVGGQLCMPLGSLNERVIIGTWETQADWEAWHADETFRETKAQLDDLQVEKDRIEWHEVLVDARATD